MTFILISDWQKLFDRVKARGRFVSDAQLAEHLALSRAQISAWRTGKSELGTLVKLKLLDALGHENLRSVLQSLWPTKNREELIRQHARLLERMASPPGTGKNVTAIDVYSTSAMTHSPAGANQLIAALPPAERARIEPHLVPVSMELGSVVYEAGDALRHVYLPTTAVISMLYVMENGASAEIAVVGRDGLLGVALFMGGETMPGRAIVQGAGDAYQLRAEVVREEFSRGGVFQRLFLRYTQALITQMAQTAVCNRHHSLAQQFCRWLLLSLDRVETAEIRMTPELVANMLGVRRAVVTGVARQLQEEQTIRYERGVIRVLDRPALEAAACECYNVVERECRRLFSDLLPDSGQKQSRFDDP